MTRMDGTALILNCTMEREFGEQHTEEIIWTKNRQRLNLVNVKGYNTVQTMVVKEDQEQQLLFRHP